MVALLPQWDLLDDHGCKLNIVIPVRGLRGLDEPCGEDSSSYGEDGAADSINSSNPSIL